MDISRAVILAVIFAVGCKEKAEDKATDGNEAQDGGVAAIDDCGFPIPGVIPEACLNDTCHTLPPVTERHPKNNLRCSRCHGHVVDENYNIIERPDGNTTPGLHMNGQKDYAVGCSSCHGWDQGMSPPQSLLGVCTAGESGVGAHRAMRYEAIPAHKTACSNCHKVPLITWDDGHVDGDGKAEVIFNHLATAQGAKPVWNGETCKNVYCHGVTLEGGTLKEPSWSDTTGQAGECGACHRLTDPGGNAEADCSSCHPTSVKSDGTIELRGTHINGMIDLPDSN